MKIQILIAIILYSNAFATEIDIGPPQKKVVGDYFSPWGDSEIDELDGQTLSIDFTFANNASVRVLKTTNKGFYVEPFLLLHGSGSITDPIGSGYTIDANGNRNSIVWNYGGGLLYNIDDETFAYGLGFLRPMLNEDGTRRVDTLNLYGLHIEFTLPDSYFEIVGDGFLMSPQGWNQWNNYFQIGPVPDTGNTFTLFTLSLVLIWKYRP